MTDDKMAASDRATRQGIGPRSRSPIPWAIIAALLFATSLLARWPGLVMYDSVTQYQQAIDGDYSDWHPPILAHTWALLNHVHAGTAPFFLIQMLLWWGGLGLFAAALGRQARHNAAACVLLIGLSPSFLGWVTVVLKDAQMACCLVAAAGIAAHWRLDGRVPPLWAKAAMLVLIAYATLVRGNAMFATIPLALALFDWGGIKRLPVRVGLMALIAGLVIGLSGPINHRLLGSQTSHVERALPLYDLAGIAHFAALDSIPGLPPAQWREAERRGCYSPYFWNPYGEEDECDFLGEELALGEGKGDGVMRLWLSEVARHPLAYAEHRLGHLNSNLRFWVASGEGDALPPVSPEPNDLKLGAPATPAGQALIGAAAVMAASPIGWPVLWLALACGLLWASARTQGGGQAAIGRALALSAACMSASFAMVSIASDLRYHLWSMIAAALAAVLLVDARALERRRATIAGGVLLALLVIASAGHAGLAPKVYQPQPVVIPAPSAKS